MAGYADVNEQRHAAGKTYLEKTQKEKEARMMKQAQKAMKQNEEASKEEHAEE